MLEEKVIERTSEINYQKDEITKQRNEIELKNSNILSSIIYARNIQKAVLPSRETFNQLLPESFIMSKPKDIVSGDFYWLAEKDNKIIISVADCTGHGVPGAFMSLLGITLMNEIVNVHGITRSDLIVSELRRRLIESLRQNRKSDITYDGMDIALCVIDTNNHKLQFTGGMNDLVYIHNAKIEIVRADHLDVSASFAESGNFKMTELNYSDGDMIYLFTDGYQDQFGGQYNKKFLRPHFYTTLFEIHKLPVLNQKEMLEKKLEVWMKSHIQTDDITVMGIRLGKNQVKEPEVNN
jgi:serine phosphatase RsbU (regulator of sigma subunit)